MNSTEAPVMVTLALKEEALVEESATLKVLAGLALKVAFTQFTSAFETSCSESHYICAFVK